MTKVPSQSNTRHWLSEPMPNGVAKSIRRLAEADDVRHLAVMPDVHLATDVCIGAVVATTRLLYPAAIGGDIGCGMAAVRFEVGAELLKSEQSAARLLAGLYGRIPTNRHSAATMPNSTPDDHAAEPLSDQKLTKLGRRDGRVQLGTLGRGNHFVEFQADDTNQLWLMVHSGSRAMGQAIAAHHLARAAKGARGLDCLDAQSEAGEAYLADVNWALRYAETNRLAMIAAAADLLRCEFSVDADWSTLMQGAHNHVRREEHFGEQFWVHRKGAQSSRSGELGIIPGSMGTASFHVTGRGCEESLCSSSHGAGRALSRTQSRKRISARQLHREMKSVWFDHRNAAALCDESPTAYKDIFSIMRAQKDLVRITRELRPLLSYKGR